MTPSPKTRAMILEALDRDLGPSNVLDLKAVFALKQSRRSRRQINALIEKKLATKQRIAACNRTMGIQMPCDTEAT